MWCHLAMPLPDTTPPTPPPSPLAGFSVVLHAKSLHGPESYACKKMELPEPGSGAKARQAWWEAARLHCQHYHPDARFRQRYFGTSICRCRGQDARMHVMVRHSQWGHVPPEGGCHTVMLLLLLLLLTRRLLACFCHPGSACSWSWTS
jgi:hypothetical protein